MLADLVKYVRWLWDAVLLPYVITSISSLASDGWEAFTHLRESVVVLLCFLWGCSHRSFPLSRSAIDKQRAAAAAAAEAAAAGGGAAQAGSSDRPARRPFSRTLDAEADEADSEADVCKTQQGSGTTAAPTTATAMGEGGDADVSGPPPIQRRLLLGKKGEVEEWMTAVRGRLLVPPHHPLCVSRSLHQLVSIVVGPIQQPTVSTMPTRHPEPQWPPHFLRTGGSSSGGGGPAGDAAMGDPSTDDNSSSNSSIAPHTLRHRMAPSSSAAAAAARYRQASSVVYQRVSSRNLDFSSSRVAPHLIASITAHHVLSYPATRQKVLVMDLDETLCHVSTTTANMAGPPTFSEVIPTASGAELFHVWERPYARLFLATAAKLFNLVLFTSASKPYADTILQRIDLDHLLRYRFYRQDCRLVPRGLLRKMCTAAGMRGLPPNAAGITCASSDRGAGGGSSSSSGGGTAGPLGRLSASSGPVSSACGSGGGGSTTNSDDDGGGAVGRRWADTLSSDGGSFFLRRDAPASSATGAAARGAVDAGLPDIERAVMNEHGKVLVKDLRLLKVPPELLVMIDNSEECTLVNPENALVVSPYIPTAAPARDTANQQRRGGGAPCAAPCAAGGDAAVSAADALKPDTGGVDAAAAGPSSEPSAEDSVLGDDMSAAEGGDEDEDEVLLGLLPLLECLLVVPDVRSILRHGKLY